MGSASIKNLTKNQTLSNSEGVFYKNMDLYKQQYQKATKQQNDLKNDVDTILIFESSNIVNKVKTRWSWGRGVNGGIIGEYSKSQLGQKYRAYKLTKNPNARGTVDLILSGSLSNKLTLKRLGGLFEVISTDSKFNSIGQKYGFEEFNLTEEETKQLQNEIIEKILTNYTYEVWQNV